MAASVRIVAHGTGMDAGGSGTTFYADSRGSFVLTCKHVVAGARSFDVYASGAKISATLVAVDPSADLACLYVAAPLPTIPLADKMPTPGTVCWQVGYPHMVGPVKRYGRLRGVSGRVPGAGGGFDDYGWDIKSDHGDSGSGIFTADRHLVAVLWGGDTFTSASVGLDDCWRFVEERCLIIGIGRRRRPPVSPAPGPTAPEAPPVPVMPPPMPAPSPLFPLPDLDGRLGKINDGLEDLKAKVAAAKARADAAHNLIATVKDVADAAHGKAGALEGAFPGLAGKIADVDGKLGPIVGKIVEVDSKLAPIVAKVAEVAGASGAPSLLTLAGGIGGPVGIGLAGGLSLLGLLLRRKAAAAQSKTDATPTAPTSTPSAAPSAPAAGAVAAPAPQTIIQQKTNPAPYPVDATSDRLAWAKQELIGRNDPAAVNVIRDLENLMNQYGPK